MGRRERPTDERFPQTRQPAGAIWRQRLEIAALRPPWMSLGAETDATIRDVLALTAASLEIKTGDKDARIGAIRTLAQSSNPATKTQLLGLLEKNTDGTPIDSTFDRGLPATFGRMPSTPRTRSSTIWRANQMSVPSLRMTVTAERPLRDTDRSSTK